MFAGLTFAFSPLIWAYATGAEVFALNNFFAALIFYLAFVWHRSRDVRVAYALASFFLFLALQCESPVAMAGLAALSSLGMACTLPMWWSCAIGVSGRHVGSLFGLMNMLGVFGAMGSQYFVGAYTTRAAKNASLTVREQWDPLFGVYMLVLLAGAVAWVLYRTRPVEQIATETLKA